MTQRSIAAIEIPRGLRVLAFEPPSSAIDRWNAGLGARALSAKTSIDIFDFIGLDPFSGEGVGVKAITAALKGAGDVVVNMNSPGGDFFEGIAMYNALRAHPGRVEVNILGLAASAASIVAMAGDTIRIGKAASMMVHNAWGIVVGNKADMTKAADDFEGFDAAMAGVYKSKTGLPLAAIERMMTAETWMDGNAAVAQGFADGLLPADVVTENAAAKAAGLVKVEARRRSFARARSGLSDQELDDFAKAVDGERPSLSRLQASLARLERALN